MKHFITLLFPLFLIQSILSQGYEVKIKLKAFGKDTVVLGHRFNESFIPKDTAILNERGNGTFTGKEPLPQGMYLLYLPNKTYFDMLISDDQFFYVENDTADFITNIKIEGSSENVAFYDYQKYLKQKRESAINLQEKLKSAKNESDSDKIKKQLDALNQEVETHISSLIEKYNDTFFGKFMLALQEIKVPDPPRDEEGRITDSLFQYKYYKNHYFDNFDISDVRLLRTPFYENKILTYIEKIAVQIPDSLIKEVDMLIRKSRSDPQLFRYMLITLFNHFASSQIMGMDAVYIHLAEKYYIPEADWSDPDFINKLKERVEKAKPTLIGETARDIQLVEVSTEHFIHAADDEELKKNPYVGRFFNLNEIKAKFIILYFWESDCGHCKKATPELYEVYKRLKPKGLEVIAINTLSGEEGKVKWINYINENGFYDWINCWNPYDFQYKTIYNILSTPGLFVLDEEKKIVAKKITPEQAEQIINSLLEKQTGRLDDTRKGYQAGA